MIKTIPFYRALEMLENSDKNISGIVYSIGLTSRSYFSKIFSKKFGQPPTEYKESLSNPDVVQTKSKDIYIPSNGHFIVLI